VLCSYRNVLAALSLPNKVCNSICSRAQLEDIKSLNLEVSTRLAESQKSLLHKTDIIRKLETKVTHHIFFESKKRIFIVLLQCRLQHNWLMVLLIFSYHIKCTVHHVDAFVRHTEGVCLDC